MLQVGVDCEEIARFRRLPFGKNERFYKRIFTPEEIRYCTSFRDPYPRFAVRFAAKEAAIKALNDTARLFYTDVEVRKGSDDRPRLRFDGKKFKGGSRLNVSLSLTHSNSHAIAFVVIADGKAVLKKTKLILEKEIRAIRRRVD